MRKEPMHLFWLDMEMSGLDVNTKHILEVALLVTDENFNVLETYESVVYQPQEVLNDMDSWCKVQHAKTGLVQKIPDAPSLPEVEGSLVEIFRKYAPKGKAILAGNTIYQDRKFIDKWMVKLSSYLHYRMCDVSSFKIIFESKFNKKFKKRNRHRALDDIVESIDEMKFYLSFLNPVLSQQESGNDNVIPQA